VTKGDALAASAKPAVAPLAPAAAKPALQQVATPSIASLGDRPEERVPMSACAHVSPSACCNRNRRTPS